MAEHSQMVRILLFALHSHGAFASSHGRSQDFRGRGGAAKNFLRWLKFSLGGGGKPTPQNHSISEDFLQFSLKKGNLVIFFLEGGGCGPSAPQPAWLCQRRLL